MNNPYLLWLLGLLLIYFEFYIPGAIVGVTGGVLVFTSLILFAMQSTSALAIVFYTTGVISSVVLLIRFALWRIRHANPDSSIYSNKDQEGFIASSFDRSAIGKIGVVLSDLKPGGFILIEGQQHQALSQSGYIERGREVLVVGGQEESLIVKHVNKDQPS
jgi:membrane-bound ClpP family serine protease